MISFYKNGKGNLTSIQPLQFDLLVHYLWKFKKDEYSWHLRDWDAGKFKQHDLFHKRLSNNPKVIELNRPIMAVMKHLPNHKDFN